MKNHNTSRLGFTLIELLVVVLIIGILASVALPKYQKAVRKARLSEVTTRVSSIAKGIDMWLLENGGYPSGQEFYFSGNGTGNGNAKLDVDQSCVTQDSYYCYTSVGMWVYFCSSNYCNIVLSTSYNADGTNNPENKWLNGTVIHWYKIGDGEWGMVGSWVTATVRPEVCRWWKGIMGGRVINNNGTISDACDAY